MGSVWSENNRTAKNRDAVTRLVFLKKGGVKICPSIYEWLALSIDGFQPLCASGVSFVSLCSSAAPCGQSWSRSFYPCSTRSVCVYAFSVYIYIYILFWFIFFWLTFFFKEQLGLEELSLISSSCLRGAWTPPYSCASHWKKPKPVFSRDRLIWWWDGEKVSVCVCLCVCVCVFLYFFWLCLYV